jgi:hypothetical protein
MTAFVSGTPHVFTTTALDTNADIHGFFATFPGATVGTINDHVTFVLRFSLALIELVHYNHFYYHCRRHNQHSHQLFLRRNVNTSSTMINVRISYGPATRLGTFTETSTSTTTIGPTITLISTVTNATFITFYTVSTPSPGNISSNVIDISHR